MSLAPSMRRPMLTAEGLGGHTLNFPSPKRLLSCFGEGKFNFHIRQADGTGRQNVKLQPTRGELDPVLGVGWGSRSLSTSTVCEVDPSYRYIYPVGIKWFYKARIDFDHSTCPRCTWRGVNVNRPSLCSPRKLMIPGPPWLELSFCKRRINRLQVTIIILLLLSFLFNLLFVRRRFKQEYSQHFMCRWGRCAHGEPWRGLVNRWWEKGKQKVECKQLFHFSQIACPLRYFRKFTRALE